MRWRKKRIEKRRCKFSNILNMPWQYFIAKAKPTVKGKQYGYNDGEWREKSPRSQPTFTSLHKHSPTGKSEFVFKLITSLAIHFRTNWPSNKKTKRTRHKNEWTVRGWGRNEQHAMESVSISLPLSERININITLYVIGNRFFLFPLNISINDWRRQKKSTARDSWRAEAAKKAQHINFSLKRAARHAGILIVFFFFFFLFLLLKLLLDHLTIIYVSNNTQRSEIVQEIEEIVWGETGLLLLLFSPIPPTEIFHVVPSRCCFE